MVMNHKWQPIKSNPNSVFVMAITSKWSTDCSKVLQSIYFANRNLYKKETDFFVFGILNHGNSLLSSKLS